MNLPGNVRVGDYNEPCEKCGKASQIEVQGETDSFGAEFSYFCLGHKPKNASWETEGECDRCGAEDILKPWRDFEEGSNGPVYWACEHCRNEEYYRDNERSK